MLAIQRFKPPSGGNIGPPPLDVAHREAEGGSKSAGSSCHRAISETPVAKRVRCLRFFEGSGRRGSVGRRR
jgi:hypothetical protein